MPVSLTRQASAATGVRLAALGLYGVLAHAAAMVLIGLGLGIAGALALTRLMTTMLFEVSAFDPLAFAAAAVSMMLVGLCAALITAGPAARVDPVMALRSEA